MKIIEVFIKLVNDEIKDQTILKIYDHTGDLHRYTFNGKFKAFYDECDDELGDYFIDTPDEVVNELENELNSVLTFWMLRHDLDQQIFRYIPVSELDII